VSALHELGEEQSRWSSREGEGQVDSGLITSPKQGLDLRTLRS